jgi:hypothetical protein
MKLGEYSSTFGPNGDSSTKLESQVPVTLSFVNKDASDELGSGGGDAITYSQAINIFNSYIVNTSLTSLIDVDPLLANASIDDIFVMGSDGKWTYQTPTAYTLPISSSSILGGVKIGSGLSINGDGILSVIFPSAYSLPISTASVLGGVRIGDNIAIDGDGIISVASPITYILPKASSVSLGGIIVGSNLSIDINGVLSSGSTVATSSILGGVKIGNNISVTEDGTISVASPSDYTLPTATSGSLGGVKIGTRLSINAGVLSADLFTETDPIFTAWDKHTGIHITESQITDLQDYLLTETDPVFIVSPAFGITNTDIANWNDANNYTHPTQPAISPTLSGANVLASLIVNTLGHTTTATTRTLTLANLGYTGDTNANYYVHPASGITPGTYQSITFDINGHATTATNPTTLAGYGITDAVATSDSRLSDARVASDVYSWAKASTKPSYTWSEIGSHPTALSQFTNDLGNYGSFVTGTPWTSVGYWYSSSHPTTITGYGITDAVHISDLSSISGVYTIVLPSSGSVAGRCVTPISLPSGWTVAADSNPNDLLITHGLGKGICNVTIFQTDSSGDRLLYANASHSGLIAPTTSTLRIEGLATITKTITIHMLFTQ